MYKKREQAYTVRVAHMMQINVDEYLYPSRSFDNIKYDTDGIDDEIQKRSKKAYNLKTKYFSEYKRLKENDDDSKTHELILAKDKTDGELYELVTSISW